MSDRSVPQILQAVHQALGFMEQGVADYRAGGDRRVSGLRTAVTTGRSVSFVLQNLRGKAAGFDDWYSMQRATLEAHPTAKWFTQFRNQIEKRGDLGTPFSTLTLNFDASDRWPDPPAGAVSTVINDAWGRSFWTVRLADGTDTEVYFDVPSEMASQSVTLQGAPDGRDIRELLEEYLQLLRALVAAADEQFL